MRPNRDGGNLFLQCSLSGEQLRIAHRVLFDEFKLDCRFDDVVENTHAFPAFAVAAEFVGVLGDVIDVWVEILTSHDESFLTMLQVTAQRHPLLRRPCRDRTYLPFPHWNQSLTASLFAK